MTGAPKPTSGYIVVNPGWDPVGDRTWAWNPLPGTKAGLAEARDGRDHALSLGNKKVIVKIETRYTVVEDVSDD